MVSPIWSPLQAWTAALKFGGHLPLFKGETLDILLAVSAPGEQIIQTMINDYVYIKEDPINDDKCVCKTYN